MGGNENQGLNDSPGRQKYSSGTRPSGKGITHPLNIQGKNGQHFEGH